MYIYVYIYSLDGGHNPVVVWATQVGVENKRRIDLSG